MDCEEGDDYLSDASATNTDYKFPEISEIVERRSGSPERAGRGAAARREDPFLRDLQAKLQLKRRQREERAGGGEAEGKSPEAVTLTKRFNLHSFNLSKSVRFDSWQDLLMMEYGVCIHWNGKNNHFRFSLSLFTFFTLRLFPEEWKSDFFTFQKRK